MSCRPVLLFRYQKGREYRLGYFVQNCRYLVNTGHRRCRWHVIQPGSLVLNCATKMCWTKRLPLHLGSRDRDVHWSDRPNTSLVCPRGKPTNFPQNALLGTFWFCYRIWQKLLVSYPPKGHCMRPHSHPRKWQQQWNQGQHILWHISQEGKSDPLNPLTRVQQGSACPAAARADTVIWAVGSIPRDQLWTRDDFCAQVDTGVLVPVLTT